MEIYNIRDLKIIITKVLYTPSGSRFRLGCNFAESNIQDSKYLFLIYSGKQRFIEVGFDDNSVYKALRFIFRQNNINKLILKIVEFFNDIRTK